MNLPSEWRGTQLESLLRPCQILEQALRTDGSGV